MFYCSVKAYSNVFHSFLPVCLLFDLHIFIPYQCENRSKSYVSVLTPRPWMASSLWWTWRVTLCSSLRMWPSTFATIKRSWWTPVSTACYMLVTTPSSSRTCCPNPSVSLYVVFLIFSPTLPSHHCQQCLVTISLNLTSLSFLCVSVSLCLASLTPLFSFTLCLRLFQDFSHLFSPCGFLITQCADSMLLVTSV